MRKIDCPFLEGAFIALPDQWLGRDAARRDRAIEAGEEKKLTRTLLNFAVAMALLEDWNLPGLTGNPEQWDYERIDLQLIAWVSSVVNNDFLSLLLSPATYSPRSGNGPVTSAATKTAAPGSSESAT
jgi:hypothetical protein